MAHIHVLPFLFSASRFQLSAFRFLFSSFRLPPSAFASIAIFTCASLAYKREAVKRKCCRRSNASVKEGRATLPRSLPSPRRLRRRLQPPQVVHCAKEPSIYWRINLAPCVPCAAIRQNRPVSRRFYHGLHGLHGWEREEEMRKRGFAYPCNPCNPW